jgi:hypothetical protein
MNTNKGKLSGQIKDNFSSNKPSNQGINKNQNLHEGNTQHSTVQGSSRIQHLSKQDKEISEQAQAGNLASGVGKTKKSSRGSQ